MVGRTPWSAPPTRRHFESFPETVVNSPCLWGTIPSTHMSSPTASETMNPGRRLGHYEIQARLGSGGMGTVYQALDTRLNRAVALKVLSPDRLEGTSGRGRLVREAQAASALNHPNIVTVYEVGHDEGVDFIAME